MNEPLDLSSLLELPLNNRRVSRNARKRYLRQRQSGVIIPPMRFEKTVASSLNVLNASFVKKMYDKLLSNLQIVKDSIEENEAFVGESIRGIANTPDKTLEFVLSPKFEEGTVLFFEYFLKDLPESFAMEISFSLDKNEVFKNRIGKIQEFYLDEAIKRTSGGQDLLREKFVKKMSDYITTQKVGLDGLEEIYKEILSDGKSFSKFFARDQFARFGRALTLASYDEGGYTKVEWLTVGDGRVRKSHEKLNGKVFDIDNLPDEIHDFNCRCTFAPVE